MNKWYLAMAGIAFTCAIALPGCPLPNQASADVVGAWVVRVDLVFGCVSAQKTPYFVVLYADHSAELLGMLKYEGDWEYVDSMIAISIPDVQPNVNLSLIGFVENGAVQNGILEASSHQQTDVSCWNGQRVAS
jgi:hypothetical protein